jgi:putative oxidoreductase
MVHLAAAGAAALLLVGLWTPVAGVLFAIVELGLALFHPGDRWMHMLVGALGIVLAMLGPGAWSVDARLFGRKRIRIPQR